jgi:hypothetical protein
MPPQIRIPPQVSRYYKYDWQFAASVGHLTLLRSAALVIAIMPIILELSRGAWRLLACSFITMAHVAVIDLLSLLLAHPVYSMPEFHQAVWQLRRLQRKAALASVDTLGTL